MKRFGLKSQMMKWAFLWSQRLFQTAVCYLMQLTCFVLRHIGVVLNSVHPMCFCGDEIVEVLMWWLFLVQRWHLCCVGRQQKMTRPWCSGWTLWLRKPCSPFNLFHLIKRENSVWPARWGGGTAAGIWAKTAGNWVQAEELAEPRVVKVHTYTHIHKCLCACLCREIY